MGLGIGIEMDELNRTRCSINEFLLFESWCILCQW